jgi:hypothetical protein
VGLIILLSHSRGRMLPVKPIGLQPNNSPHFMDLEVSLCFSRETSFFPTLWRINPVHPLLFYLLNIYSNIIIPYKLILPTGPFRLGFFTTVLFVFLSLVFVMTLFLLRFVSLFLKAVSLALIVCRTGMSVHTV